ncbi:dihydropteridine reductase [Sphingomonas sp. BHC-A]|uniref:Flavohemoprotein n=1 Tax=Sphingobium indicum (strain DSM 16412 / CCM 7286 / MTCC 6364 / B90A) TaxID=861109 RepID=A0A1L5BKD5_SPHIB|nr:NO-inducible flavohemoprotein [Sphingobium indicum]APL93363.1 dihydropteridine reductase [Sphingobium indicum B90A]KEZ00205.1 dihydropteridine reductase [Sphingomonas sp. BHC-A]
MSQPLSEQTIALVKATVPALEAHGLDIVHEMYSRMFENPQIRDLFNQSHHGDAGSQPRALTGAILAYASNIDNLGALAPAVERIAQKHVGLQILPEHYPHVAEALLGAIKAVLGDAATDDILGAWGEAYWFLANILIAREGRVYTEQKETIGGWNGWRDFRVVEVVPESSVIKSFVLRPVDGKPVMAHIPGQYLTFWLEIPGHPPVKRNYSISAAPNGRTYRISVKREPLGLASGWLHDEAEAGTILKVAAPAGEFFLADHVERPVVLLSGGVGLTPMVAMLEALVASGTDIAVHYIHGTHDRDTHAMRDHVRAVAARGKAVKVTDFHQTPLADEIEGRDYDAAGIITDEWLVANTPVADADYYICGPRPFLRHAVSTLSLAGVASARIHYEFFGPADELLAA